MNLWQYSRMFIFICLFSEVCCAFTVQRTIIGLYSSQEELDYSFTRIHRFAEQSLNYLGYIVKEWDIDKGFPDDSVMQNCEAFFSWFETTESPQPELFLEWIDHQITNNRKCIIFGLLPIFTNSKTKSHTPLGSINAVFAPLKIKFTSQYQNNPLLITVDYCDTAYMAYERPFDLYGIEYEEIISLSDENTPYLILSRKDQQNQSSMVLTNKRFGLAWGNTILYIQNLHTTSSQHYRQLRLNLPAFFQKVLDSYTYPKVDVCVKNGKRIAFSHIDGDGFNNRTETDNNKISAEILYDSILSVYQFPISVSFITSDIDPSYFGSKETIALTQKIARLPHIELASHTFSHPFIWTADQRNLFKDKYEDESIPIKGYTFNLQKEITGTKDFLDGLFNETGKKITSIFWSGNCLPDSHALALAEKNKLFSINGGESRYDRLFNSQSYLYPLGRFSGNYFQVYAVNCNENIYTNNWQNTFNGFKNILQTFHTTSTPSLHRPIDMYYHFYSASKKASLKALRQVYDSILKEDICPIFTSEYCEMVHGFLRAQILFNDNQSWEVSPITPFTTLRFDDTSRIPDMARSTNIMGYCKKKGKLYLHCGSKNRSIIAFCSEKNTIQIPYLEQTNCMILKWNTTSSKISFVYKNFLSPIFTFKGFSPGQKADISIKFRHKSIITALSADSKGKVQFSPVTEPADTGIVQIQWRE